jgi:hypothetical protein
MDHAIAIAGESCRVCAVMRWLRLLIGLCLLPACAVVALALSGLLRGLGDAAGSMVTPEVTALAVGFAVWLFLYFTMPRPARSYVLAHELSHVLWAWLCGIRVFSIRIRQESGSVCLEHTNPLVTLAPYFFPFYTMLVISAYGILAIFLDPEPYRLYWLGLVGFSWGFHFVFTIAALMQHQTDVRDCGHVLSYALVFLLNVTGIGLWVVAVSTATLEDLMAEGRHAATLVGRSLGGTVRTAIAAAAEKVDGMQ